MSLLIKALKQAEKRHQEAQREADAALAGRDEPIDDAALRAAAAPLQAPRAVVEPTTLALDPMPGSPGNTSPDSDRSEHSLSSEGSPHRPSVLEASLETTGEPSPLPALDAGESFDARLAATAPSPAAEEAGARSVLLGVLPARVGAPEASPGDGQAAEPPLEVRFDPQPRASAAAAPAPASTTTGRFKPSSRMVVVGTLALAACGVGAWFTAALLGLDPASLGGSNQPVTVAPPVGAPMIPPLPTGDWAGVSARIQNPAPVSSERAASSPAGAGTAIPPAASGSTAPASAASAPPATTAAATATATGAAAASSRATGSAPGRPAPAQASVSASPSARAQAPSQAQAPAQVSASVSPSAPAARTQATVASSPTATPPLAEPVASRRTAAPRSATAASPQPELAADASDATSVLPARPTRANAAAAAAAPAAPAGAPRLTRTLVPADEIDRLLDAAWSAAAARRTADARRLYSEVLQLDRNNVDAYVGLAHVAVQAGDGVAAERAWRRVLDIEPNDPVARAGLVALLGPTDAGAQESQLRHLAATSPSDPALQFTLGNVMAAQGRWAEAQQAFFAAVAGEPDQPDYLFNLAVSLERLRQPGAALPLYRKALDAAAVRPARFEAEAARARIAAIELARADAPTVSRDPVTVRGVARSPSGARQSSVQPPAADVPSAAPAALDEPAPASAESGA